MKPISFNVRVIQSQKKIVSLLTSLCLVSACSAGSDHGSRTKEAWDEKNDPSLFSLKIMNLDDLPEEGEIPDSKFPWSDTYWPTYAGGISQRWQEEIGSTDYHDYLYTLADGEDLLNDPGAVDITKLSPAEKFDLYQNRYDFPLTRFEQDRMRAAVNADDEIPTWFGLCHGWAVASLMEDEPGDIAVVKNERGLEIPFYTSDISALLTHVYAFSARQGRIMGDRCNTKEHDIEYDENGRVVLRECRDLNPGSLHLALTQMLGLPDRENREPFTLDMTFSEEVWNYPIVGYHVQSIDVEDYDDDDLTSYRADGTEQLAHVEMEVYYVVGTDPHRGPLLSEREHFTKSETYSYTLELDGDGRIIGGEWDSETRPDFMWMISEKPAGTTLVPHAEVANLLKISRGE